PDALSQTLNSMLDSIFRLDFRAIARILVHALAEALCRRWKQSLRKGFAKASALSTGAVHSLFLLFSVLVFCSSVLPLQFGRSAVLATETQRSTQKISGGPSMFNFLS